MPEVVAPPVVVLDAAVPWLLVVPGSPVEVSVVGGGSVVSGGFDVEVSVGVVGSGSSEDGGGGGGTGGGRCGGRWPGGGSSPVGVRVGESEVVGGVVDDVVPAVVVLVPGGGGGGSCPDESAEVGTGREVAVGFSEKSGASPACVPGPAAIAAAVANTVEITMPEAAHSTRRFGLASGSSCRIASLGVLVVRTVQRAPGGSCRGPP
ncbi:hypothetical protein [Saccharopolyspora cebuensis]|uniref:Uncharacterized protein n=1 Tax=Saccharopolyspora cebuensis TaxID=418759 RepID=A0ABV4CPI3_9PSEU